MSFKMICLDLDGTLLNTEHRITPYSKEVLRQLVEKGVHVVLVSSRMPAAIEKFYQELELTGPMISYGGACAFVGGKAIPGGYIPMEGVEKIAQKAKELGIHLSIYQDADWYVDSMDYYAVQESNTVEVVPTVEPYSQLIPRLKAEGKGASKLLPLGPAEGVVPFGEFLLAEMGEYVNAFINSPTYIEVLPYGVDKAKGIDVLCEHLGVELSAVIAMGDTATDLPMIRHAGLGIAMKNATQAVLDEADEIAPWTCDEDGLAKLIGKYLL